MSSWQAWHDDYEDPTSELSKRLALVRARIRAWASGADEGPLRLISVCAGQGHDVVGALAAHPRRRDASGILVERDEENVAPPSGACGRRP